MTAASSPPPGGGPVTMQGAVCPLPHGETERVLLGHGSGGQLSAELLRDLVGPALAAAAPGPLLDDAAVVELPGGRGALAFSTDAFVVNPRFFPGGSIGDLAVNGTVNDLAMMGAQPLALSLAYVVEEGLPLDELRRVTEAAGRAAHAAGVRVVTGDTKVVGRGAADGLFVISAGIGLLGDARPAAGRARPGDVVLLSGPIATHGMAVMSVREGLGFEAEIASDTRPLHRLVAALVAAAPGVHTLRDPTRGGLASALNEIALAAGVGVEIDEDAVPVAGPVHGACEMLGLDPMHVANEGILVAFVPPEQAGAALAALRSLPEGAAGTVVGRALTEHPGRVVVRTMVGARRVLDMLVGEQLPRIC